MSRIARWAPWGEEAKWWVRERPIPLRPPVMRIDFWGGGLGVGILVMGRGEGEVGE